MTREYTRWTDETIAKLIELWRAEVSVGAISQRLGHSKASIHQRVHLLRKAGADLPRRGHTSEPAWVTRRNLARKKSEAA